jgi:DNA-directed RNA polymerase specialized sigma24 family protein
VNPTSATGGLDTFEGERPRLTGLAYRITCSLADAEDVVQEAWIRWAARDAATVDNPAGWLTTVTSRLALDRLRAQRRRREVYVGPRLPARCVSGQITSIWVRLNPDKTAALKDPPPIV